MAGRWARTRMTTTRFYVWLRASPTLQTTAEGDAEPRGTPRPRCTRPRCTCVVPGSDGASLTHEGEDALWARPRVAPVALRNAWHSGYHAPSPAGQRDRSAATRPSSTAASG